MSSHISSRSNWSDLSVGSVAGCIGLQEHHAAASTAVSDGAASMIRERHRPGVPTGDCSQQHDHSVFESFLDRAVSSASVAGRP